MESESSHRLRHGEYCVEFGFDPFAESEPKRLVTIRKQWRSMEQSLFRMPAIVYYAGVAVALMWFLRTAYYPEKVVYYIVLAATAWLAIVVMRWFRRPWRYVGIALAAVSIGFVFLMLIASWIPEMARTFAIPRLIERRGMVEILEHPEWMSANRSMQTLTGRDLWISDLNGVRGPLSAFSPEIVRDLHVPNSVVITINSPSEDEIDRSENVRAIAPKAPMLQGSWMNTATLRSLAKTGLRCELLIFEDELRDVDIDFLSSPQLDFNTLRLHRMTPDVLLRLQGLVDAGRVLGKIYLVDCQLDAASAAVMAQLQASIIMDVTDREVSLQLPLEELDAMVASGLQVKKIFCDRVNAEQARRLAAIPSLSLLTAVLSDDAAVDYLSKSALEVVTVYGINETVVASLMRYPKLGSVAFEVIEGSVDVAIPLMKNTALHGIGVTKYRGTADQIARVKRLLRLSVKHVEEVPEPVQKPE